MDTKLAALLSSDIATTSATWHDKNEFRTKSDFITTASKRPGKYNSTGAISSSVSASSTGAGLVAPPRVPRMDLCCCCKPNSLAARIDFPQGASEASTVVVVVKAAELKRNAAARADALVDGILMQCKYFFVSS